MNRIRWYGPSLVLLATVLVALVAGPVAVRQIAWAQTDARIHLARNGLEQNEALAQISQAFRNVAQVVEPSVVHVEVLSRDGAGRNPMNQLEDFFGPRGGNPFGEMLPDVPEQAPENPYEQYNREVPFGNGSGWVYDQQGHIITNNHVIQNADKIRVHFQDGSSYEAQVVGTDPNTDVAVLKVDATDLHAVAISQEQVEPGDIVFAFGSPFGFKFSMSQGVVSAEGRHLNIIDQGYENFIQTDAAINPGNSGGPLTNIYGEVIGMNTAIASRARAPGEAGFMGLGFAIPVDMVARVVDQIIEKGAVSRGFLGVYIDVLSPKMARTFGYDGEGVLVVGPTSEDSPAAQADIRSGDIITQINGESVSDPDELRYMIAGLNPGSEVDVSLYRNGETIDTTVTLGELSAQGLAAREPNEAETQGPTASEGLETLRKYGISGAETFNRQLAQRLNVDFREGVLITDVRRGSVAEGQGLARGLLVTQVQGRDIASIEDFTNRVESLDASQGFRLRVQVWNPQTRNWMPRFVLFEVPRQ